VQKQHGLRGVEYSCTSQSSVSACLAGGPTHMSQDMHAPTLAVHQHCCRVSSCPRSIALLLASREAHRNRNRNRPGPMHAQPRARTAPLPTHPPPRKTRVHLVLLAPCAHGPLPALVRHRAAPLQLAAQLQGIHLPLLALVDDLWREHHLRAPPPSPRRVRHERVQAVPLLSLLCAEAP